MVEKDCKEENFLKGMSGSESSGWMELLYDCFSSTVYGVIGQMIGFGESAEDALQEVFVKIWKSAPAYSAKKGRVYTWILNITRNHCIDILRSKGHREEGQTTSLAVEKVNRSYEWDSAILGLNELIKKLPEDQYRLIRMAYFEGYTQREIADKLDIPIGTVKSRIRLAIKKLRKLLEIEYEQ